MNRDATNAMKSVNDELREVFNRIISLKIRHDWKLNLSSDLLKNPYSILKDHSPAIISRKKIVLSRS